jgi:1,2-dihydroxy-3-keto-5-methylthiopentene dioxygenase
MALITLENTKRTILDSDRVQEFLTHHGVRYENWEISDAVRQAACQDRLTDQDKSTILSIYQKQLNRLRLESGYIQNDMVCLSPQTPQIDQLLSKFDREHYHTDDEVRFVVGGRGIFGFEGRKGIRFTIEVGPGDFLVIPARSWHWFMLGENRSIKAIRLFQDMSGWVPVYRDPSIPTLTLPLNKN